MGSKIGNSGIDIIGNTTQLDSEGKSRGSTFYFTIQLFDNKYSMFFYNTKWSLLIRKSFP
ncbi:hypothetical protein LCGC14_3088350, partial [marine sediment metagenome]